MSNKQAIMQMVVREAERQGIDPRLALAYVDVESSFKPKTGNSIYKGLFQLSHNEFKKHGGSGDIFNPQSNIKAGLRKMKADMAWYKSKTGKDPGLFEMYMVHQRGKGGSVNHAMLDPNEPAWKAMYNTSEGRRKGKAWAQRTIWQNVDSKLYGQFGGKYALGQNMTNGQFMNFWGTRMNGKWKKYGGEGDMPLPFGGTAPSAEDIGDAIPTMSPRAKQKAVEQGVVDHYFNPETGQANPMAEHRGPMTAPLPTRGDRTATAQDAASQSFSAPSPQPSNAGFLPEGVKRNAAMSPEFGQGQGPFAPIQPQFATAPTNEEVAAHEDEKKFAEHAATVADINQNQVEHSEEYQPEVGPVAEGSGIFGGYGEPYYNDPPAFKGIGQQPKASAQLVKAPAAPQQSLQRAASFAPRNTFNLQAINQLIAKARKFGV